MPFKLSYSFEGNHRTRPEQNLSGASRKQSRDALLQRAHEERQKRQEQRLKLRSTEILQSHIRSYLVRKQKKAEERTSFDEIENSAPLNVLLRKLLFFYYHETDSDRLIRICERLLTLHEEVLQRIELDREFSWLIKRILVRAMQCIFSTQHSNVILQCLDVFTINPNITEYLIDKRLFQYLKYYFNGISENDNSMKCVLSLIHRPFGLHTISQQGKMKVLSEFYVNFLGCVDGPTKTILIPYFKKQQDIPYNDIINHLSEAPSTVLMKDLLYSVLALEPDDFEPTKTSLQVLASISVNIKDLNPSLITIADDSDTEGDQAMSSQGHLLNEIVQLLNKTDRVKKILMFFDRNSDDEEVLIALTQLCHNLLLVYKESIRKFMLLYLLALKGTFLNRLWRYVERNDSNILLTIAMQWRDPHKAISVFCDMFTFYTETLTDSESTDTSGTFTSRELRSMSEMLKTMSMFLIDYAFPMCRSSMINVTPEILHFYSSCLHAVKMLYMLDLRKKFCTPGFWTSTKIPISQFLPRGNYLSKKIQPFVGLVIEDEDEHLPPLSTIEQRSLAIMQQLPFFIEFNARVQLLRLLCRCSVEMDAATALAREFSTDSAVVIRRTHLYEDAFEELSLENESDLKRRVRIQFINSIGLEEAGIDGGGIFKEFINEVLKTAFDPNRGFFLLTADNMLYPNPNVHLIVENYAQHYFFIGRLVGKAIFENILVDLPLAEFFLVKMLVDRASAHQLKSLDPILYRNLLYLRDYPGDVQDLGLDFTTANNDLGETRIIELKTNGRNIPVTNDNRLEYIHRLADFKLNGQMKKQCDAFRDGLDSVVPLLWLRLFNHYELQVIIGGDTQEIDLVDLREHTAYGGEFTADHPTILLFWQVLGKFTDTQKKQLLKFVTSCSRPPLLGFKELNPSFCIHSSGTEDRMPTASTCLNLLKIPIIKEENVLREKLLSAIAQQAGFELS